MNEDLEHLLSNATMIAELCDDSLGLVFLEDFLVPSVLAMPAKEVPTELREFFVEWRKKCEEMQAKYEPWSQKAEAIRNEGRDPNKQEAEEALVVIDKIMEEARQFRSMVTEKAPESFPETLRECAARGYDSIIQQVGFVKSVAESYLKDAETLPSDEEPPIDDADDRDSSPA